MFPVWLAMMRKLPKSIFITGATSGIGKALAQHYAGIGVTLFLSGRNAERLDAVAQLCTDQGADVHTAVIDVTDRDVLSDWIVKFDDIEPIDLVIANAGISGGTGGFNGAEPADQVRAIFDVNVTGVFNTIDPILPRMTARQSGQIAIMSSLASFSGWPGAPAYSASKGAVRFYGEALRGAMAEQNIKINVICPGFIRTPMTDVNDYDMPFMMDADKAAEIISKGLAKNKARIAFPWQTYFLAGFFGILPYGISSFFMNRTPKKPASNLD